MQKSLFALRKWSGKFQQWIQTCPIACCNWFPYGANCCSKACYLPDVLQSSLICRGTMKSMILMRMAWCTCISNHNPVACFGKTSIYWRRQMQSCRNFCWLPMCLARAAGVPIINCNSHCATELTGPSKVAKPQRICIECVRCIAALKLFFAPSFVLQTSIAWIFLSFGSIISSNSMIKPNVVPVFGRTHNNVFKWFFPSVKICSWAPWVQLYPILLRNLAVTFSWNKKSSEDEIKD